MTQKTNKVLQQSGVIPYRIIDGKVEILLITTRNRQGWVIPKGGLCKGMSPHDSAAKEAWEEAGVIGRVTTENLGNYKYRKRGNTYQVNLFLLPVETILEDWPEATSRERRWLEINQAAELVKEISLKRIIESLEQLFKELHKKNDPILWDGHPARPCIMCRQDACTTREFGIFFYLQVS